MKIIQHPHPNLRKKAKYIEAITPEITTLGQEMLQTLVPNPKNPIGVGLAANQVNKLLRLFIVLLPNKKYTPCLNPLIIKTSKKMLSDLPEKQQFLEGCLSITGYYGFVDRPQKIKVQYQTLTGLTKTAILKPPYSSYFAHELDHLNGVLFIDHLKKSNHHLYKVNKNGQLKPVKNPFS
jgi:peptide deformylase